MSARSLLHRKGNYILLDVRGIRAMWRLQVGKPLEL